MKIKILVAGCLSFSMSIMIAGAGGKNVPVPIAEDPAGSWYLSAFGGANWLSDLDASGVLLPLNPAATNKVDLGDINMDIGWIAGGAIGYAFPDDPDGRWRLELEGSYRNNGFDGSYANGIVTGDVQSLNLDGDISQVAIMINGYRDFAVWESVTPYLGIGLGAIRADLDLDVSGQIAVGPPFSESYSDNDWVFGYQIMAGLEFPLGDTWSVFAEYRFTGTTEAKFNIGGVHTIEDELFNHTALLGLRILF